MGPARGTVCVASGRDDDELVLALNLPRKKGPDDGSLRRERSIVVWGARERGADTWKRAPVGGACRAPLCFHPVTQSDAAEDNALSFDSTGSF